MNQKYSGKDIDVFVLTYNRAELLGQTLDSLLSQTATGLQITVIDNCSTDGTKDLVDLYKKFGVNYFCNAENLGWSGSFSRAQELSARPWTLLFHDDDLLHPSYCEWVLREVNKDANHVLIAAGLSFDESPDTSWIHIKTPPSPLCFSIEELASALYQGFPLCFSSVIYKTSLLKKYSWRADLYGKIADRPFILDIAKNGTSLVFDCPLVKYRVHALQDSGSMMTGPYVSQLAELHACYLNILGVDLFNPYGRAFLLNNYKLIKDEYSNLVKNGIEDVGSFEQYWESICERNGSSQLAKFIGIFFYFLRYLKPSFILKRLVHSTAPFR